MKTTNPIKLALEHSLAVSDFKRKKDTWYLDSMESVGVVNLQKSNFGQQYYINLGIWLKALGDSTYPPANKCHIRIRADQLGEESSSIGPLLDLERTTLADDVRIAELDRLVRTLVVPCVLSCTTVAGLQKKFHSGALRRAFVHRSARELLDSSSRPS